MNEQAKDLVFLTHPEAGRVELNLQLGERPFERVGLSDRQLANLVSDGARILARMISLKPEA